MQYLGFGVFAAILIGAAWWLSRSMIPKARNEGIRHGGGVDAMKTEFDPYATAPDVN